MTLQQLIYFRAIAENKNFTKASEESFVAQSSLSHAISNLEKELGVTLFYRSTGKEVELTSYGKVLLPYAEDILSKVDEAQEAIRAASNPDGGAVTILFSDMSGIRFVSQLFNEFSEVEHHKGININFEQIQACDRVPEMLKKGTADFMISSSRYTDEIETVPFIKQQLYVMVSMNHPLASRDSVTIPELADENILRYIKTTTIQHQIDELFAIHGITPHFIGSFDQWPVMMANVAIGKGIMITPMMTTSGQGTVHYLTLDEEQATRDMNISYYRNKKMSRAAQEVFDFCMSYRETLY